MHVLELFAQIGVILLMYSIGIEFSIKDLLKVKWVSLIGGPLGIAAVIGLALAAGELMGWSTLQSVSVGAVVSLASTMVLTRLLMDRGELHSEQGRTMVGITLVDDLVFVVMTVLLPSLSSMSGSRLIGVGLAFGKAVLILVPVAVVAAKVIPPLMARVPRTPNQELRVLVALGLGFATAGVTQALGLSLALGAFLAGMIVSESNVAHETLTDLLPLRNAFTALFFVTTVQHR
jgi:CPA2 family monovalent cation:H+ antiporter-2